MSQELAQDEHDADAEDYELGESRHRDGARDFELDGDEDEHGSLIRGNKYSGGDGRDYQRADDSSRAERGELQDENVVFALEEDDSDAEGDIGRTGREDGKLKKSSKKDRTD